MKTWLKLGIVALVVGVVSLLVVSASAFAQTPPGGGGPGGGGRGGMLGMGGPENSLVAVAAKALGMETTDLIATLNTGKTIADVAKDKGVALDKIVDAVIATRKPGLDQAVTSGRMTQAQAETMLATMKTNVTAQLSAAFQPRGYGDGPGGCTGMGTGATRNRGPRWNTAP